MSDLERFRDHARRMATAEHKPECTSLIPGEWRYPRNALSMAGPTWWEPPACPGCITDAERVLWARLADETDAYLDRPVERGLFASEETA